MITGMLLRVFLIKDGYTLIRVGTYCLYGCFSSPSESYGQRSLNILSTPYPRVGSRSAISSKPEQSLEAGHWLLAAIVAKDELIQVDLELSAAHTMICADKPLLKVADGSVSQRHHRFRTL